MNDRAEYETGAERRTEMRMTGRRRRLLLVSVGSLAVAAGVAYFWHRSGTSAAPPAIPASVADPEVRAALTTAREKVLAEPGSARAWGELGLIYRAHNLNAESNACFARAAELDPRDPRWPYLIGVIDLMIAPDEAIPHLRRAYDRAAEPEHKSLIRLRMAEALLERNDTDGAAALFDEEARSDPGNPRVQFGLGAVAAARGDDGAAVRHLEAAASSPFAHRKASALLAACHRRLGHPAEAERFERAAVGGPDDLPWRDRFLTDYLRLEVGRSSRLKAVEELEARGQLADAVVELEDLARTSSDDQVLVSLGINLAKVGRFGDAERLLRVVLARTPDHAVARYFLGISLYLPAERAWLAGDRVWARPRLEEAVRELRRSAELKPDKGLARVYAGLALKYLGNLTEALEECREAVRASPQLPDTHLGLGEVLLELGKPGEAVPHLETAVRLSLPGDGRAKALLDTITKAKKP